MHLLCSISSALLFASCASSSTSSTYQHPPHIEPVAYRIRTVVIDMPIDRIRELLPALGTSQPLSRATIDEQGARERLLEIARKDPALTVTPRDDIELPLGATGHVPPSNAHPLADARIPGNALDIEVKITSGRIWDAYNLHYALTQATTGGRDVTEVADTPMPDGYALEIDLVPASNSDRALVIFLQVEIVWPETGDL
jgi:hypothetical protein